MSRRRRPAKQLSPADAFWGKADPAPATVQPIRPTRDADAVPRSLGDPPMAPNPAAVQRHLAVVYEEAVRTATALAAANGLLDKDALSSDD
ncbi:MAG TPA: hypothetical protein VM142_10205 [Acidimicrobiales bacterium]|nr:hypothetical protein [Acidimicrobiales bacterium]